MGHWGPQGYFERDGSYNERERVRTKPKVDNTFHLDWTQPVASQVAALSRPQILHIENLVAATRLLAQNGLLPGKYPDRAKRQLDRIIHRMLRKEREARERSALGG